MSKPKGEILQEQSRGGLERRSHGGGITENES